MSRKFKAVLVAALLATSMTSAVASAAPTNNQLSPSSRPDITAQAIPDVSSLNPNIDYPQTVDFGVTPSSSSGNVSVQSFSTMATASSALYRGVSDDGFYVEVEAEAKTVAKSKLYSASAQTALYVSIAGSYTELAKGDVDYGSAFWDFDKTAKSTVLIHSFETGKKYKAVGSHSIAHAGSLYLVGTDYERQI
ncbi:hypothetical protein QYF50_06400 [Paenibacillus vini]|uniref:hypothetical protein n=1 Tax=Paenibacillus vini TaxID=1476024 RepID=UPI0025B6C211|nr:hypothetical protein [Paenibacillus vini]MDN4067521.1 hypothetical protein [Paenibacillus vini]